MNGAGGAPDAPLDGASLTWTCIRDTAGFRSLKTDWQTLHARCCRTNPFISWEWLFSWWQAYGDGRSLRLLTWRAGRDLVGIAPLYLQTEETGFGTRCRVLRLIGDGSFDSDYLGFLVDPAAHSAVVRHFGDGLRGDGEWDALVLRDMQESSPLPDAICNEAGRFGFPVRVEFGRCGALDLPPSFEQFLGSRQSRFRTKLRSLLKKLDQGELVFDDGCETRELRRRLRSLFALHQSRWKNTGGPGVFGAASKRLFYAHFVTRFARNGWLRLYSLRSGSVYCAHQLCFGMEGVSYLLQEGFDVSNPSASYGQMLRAAVIRDLIARGERQYDFLGGFSRHKEDWGAREGRTIHLVLARRNWRGWLYYNWPACRERMAGAAKRLLPKPVLDRLRHPSRP